MCPHPRPRRPSPPARPASRRPNTRCSGDPARRAGRPTPPPAAGATGVGPELARVGMRAGVMRTFFFRYVYFWHVPERTDIHFFTATPHFRFNLTVWVTIHHPPSPTTTESIALLDHPSATGDYTDWPGDSERKSLLIITRHFSLCFSSRLFFSAIRYSAFSWFFIIFVKHSKCKRSKLPSELILQLKIRCLMMRIIRFTTDGADGLPSITVSQDTNSFFNLNARLIFVRSFSQIRLMLGHS